MKVTRGSNMTSLRHARSAVTFDGTAGGGEAATAVPCFTTTGRVEIVAMTVYCTADLTESGATATITMGNDGNAAIRGVENAVDLNTNTWWGPSGTISNNTARNSPNATVDNEPTMVSQNIVFNPAVANITGGTLITDAWYRSVTDNGALS